MAQPQTDPIPQPAYVNPPQPAYVNPPQPGYVNPQQPAYVNQPQPQQYENLQQPAYVNPQQPQGYVNPQQPAYVNQPQPGYVNPQQPQGYVNPQQPAYPNYQNPQNPQNPQQPYNYSGPIQYHDMNQAEWFQITVDHTEYSSYWESPQAFESENISKNMKEQSHYVNFPWLIAFWVNIAVCLILLIILAVKEPNDYSDDTENGSYNNISNSGSSSYEEENIFDGKHVMSYFGYGLLVSVILNTLHVLYALFCPNVYIKMGYWFILTMCVIVAIILYIIFKEIAIVVFPIIIFLIVLILYCIIKNYILFSAAVLSYSVRIIFRYPSIFLFTMLSGVVNLLVSIMFIAMVVFNVISGHPLLFVYILFSYFWASLTFSYVTYMTGAGAAATCYFLSDTPDMPEHPVFDSFKRSVTTTFGAASLAGFILAIIKTIRYFAEDKEDSGSICSIIVCILQCILSLLEHIIQFMTQYGLIYCAVFGIPYQEGCRRFMELTFKKFIDLIINNCIIDTALTFHLVIFTILGAVLGFFLGLAIYSNYIAWIFCSLCGFLLTLCLFLIIEEPLDVYPDTIMVCFTEFPERLENQMHELSELIWDYYHKSAQEIQARNSEKSKKE